MESHDEERIMFKNQKWGKTYGNYNVTDLKTGLKRTEAAAVILMSFPGPKMIWQFGEVGYDEELNNDRLGKKPPHWEYYDVTERKALYDVFSKMNTLRNSNAAFSTSDYLADVRNQFKQILLKSSGGYVCTIANFDVVELAQEVNFGKTGQWEDYFSSINKVLDYYTERVSYLFKSDSYESEQELRVISYDYDKAQVLPAEPLPKIAVAWSNSVTFDEIMFGPRVTDTMIDSYTPYIQYQIEHINRWRTQKNNFSFTKSNKIVR